MEKYSISQLADEFDISTRTIRYYEELGLISPERTPSGTRIYSKKNRTRLRLILRGKRFGFSLDEIREMIDLFDLDRSGRKQLEKTIEYGKGKIKEVDQRILELTELRDEMLEMLDEFEQRLGGRE